MMKPQDAARLALTKVKTRKVRLVVTVIISSLLFSILFAASFLVTGVLKSINKFSDSGFGKRYLVAASGLDSGYYSKLSDKELIAKATALEKTEQAKKIAEAKRLGIDYDPKTDVTYTNDAGGPNGQTKQLNPDIPAVKKLLAGAIANNPGSQSDFEKISTAYGAKKTYRVVYMNNFSGTPNYNLSIIKNGVEQSALSTNFSGPPTGIASLLAGWQLMSNELLQPFVLNGQSVDVGTDGSVPVIAPFSAAEEALNLKPVAATAKAKVKLARLKDVRSRAAGMRIQICVRNTTSGQEVQSAEQQQQEILKNKANKDYQKPELIKDKPSTPCGPAIVTRDVRSADEKKQTSLQTQFKQEFGEKPPESHVLTLRIVGLNQDIQSGGSASIIDVFSSLLSSTLGVGWITPLESSNYSTIIANLFDTNSPTSGLAQTNFIAELPNAAATRKILSEQNCQPENSFRDATPVNDPFKKCYAEHKYFGVYAFGSSSTAIDEFSHGFSKVFKIAILVVVGIASLIMMGTVGRIIADSRRETAVFRAIGAKRLDISQIYVTYTLIVSALIGLVSLLVGLGLAEWMQSRYSDQLTTGALLAFNAKDLSQKFSMVGFSGKDLVYLLGAIIAVSLLATVIPLLNSMRRNPIKDMRDER